MNRTTIASIRLALDDGATPTDVVHRTFDRIDSSSAEHVWIALRSRSEVLEEATSLRDRVDATAPLFGVPFAVKDSIDVLGIPTTAGCPDYAYEPSMSAPVVDRLRAAGALLVGKTNMDQFATGLVGTRSPYGACRSVLDPALISGGSSSGSAVAVAAGLVPFSLGTDTAGSGRVPAACNGIVGLKPTRGLVPTRGVVPACASLDCVSIFATSVQDAAEVLGVIEGFDPGDPRSRRVRDPGREASLEPLRWGIPDGQTLGLCDERTIDAFGDAVDRWRAAGIDIVTVDLAPFLDAGRLLYDGAFVAERYTAVGAFVDAHRDAVDPTVGAIIAGARDLSAADLFADTERLLTLRRESESAWEECAAIVTPTMPRIPTVREVLDEPLDVNRELGTFTNFVNLLDLCAVAVPVVAGVHAPGPVLPLGVTVVAPAGAERRLALAAQWIEGIPGT